MVSNEVSLDVVFNPKHGPINRFSISATVFELFEVIKSKGQGGWDPNIGPEPSTVSKWVTVMVSNEVSLYVDFNNKHDPENRFSISATVFELFKVIKSKGQGGLNPNIGLEPCTVSRCVTVMVSIEVSLYVDFNPKHDPKNRFSISATVFKLFKVIKSKG